MPLNDLRAIYRERIYAYYYVSARDRPLAPASLDGLAPRLPYFMRMIRRHFPKDTNAAILELGCGHGALLYALQQAGYRNARGVDGSLEQVDAARRLGIQGVSEGSVMDVARNPRRLAGCGGGLRSD
jgi:2-polyprenyl-3-methyl-5-hydroxy-6-metoxy-1,4-benzoquinol methylase